MGEIIESECQVCEPSVNYGGWSVKPGFQLASGIDIEPPSDCLAVGSSASSSNLRPTARPTASGNGSVTISTPKDNSNILMTAADSPSLSNGAWIGIGIGLAVVVVLVGLVVARSCARKGTGIEKDP